MSGKYVKSAFEIGPFDDIADACLNNGVFETSQTITELLAVGYVGTKEWAVKGKFFVARCEVGTENEAMYTISVGDDGATLAQVGGGVSVLDDGSLDMTGIVGAEWFADYYKIYPDGTTDFDMEAIRRTFTGDIYYVGFDGASDSNSGTSQSASWATVTYARQQVSSGDLVIVNAGDYWLEEWGTALATSGAAYIGVNGEVNIWACNEDDSASFAVDGTYTNTYSMAITTLYSVWDASVDNAYWTKYYPDMPNLGWMTEQTSADDVNDNAGSWYFDGATLYVRTFDDRAPDSDIKLMIAGDQYCGVSNDSEYWENVNSVGFEFQSYVYLENTKVYLNGCRFGYAHNDNCCTMKASAEGSEFYRKDCIAGSSYKDALSGRSAANIVDINCIGVDCPISGSNNATTAHDTCNVLRLGGVYSDCAYYTVGDIQDGLSFNVAVEAYNTYEGNTGKSDFFADSNTRMYLINCSNGIKSGVASQSDYATAGNGVKYQQNSEFLGSQINVLPTDIELY